MILRRVDEKVRLRMVMKEELKKNMRKEKMRRQQLFYKRDEGKSGRNNERTLGETLRHTLPNTPTPTPNSHITPNTDSN